MDLLLKNLCIATLDPRSDAPYGLIEGGAIAIHDGFIAWLGHCNDVPPQFAKAMENDLDGRLVTPGLIDCHTHLIYGGNRAEEFELRLKGATYQELAQQGYGINSTVQATRATSYDELLRSSTARAVEMAKNGITTLEIKSGYGLDFEHEGRSLRAVREIGRATGLTVLATCLSAHSVPKDFSGSKDDYIDQVCTWLPKFAARGLVDAVDAFTESIAFSPEQVERVFQCARALRLPVKLHAEQLSDLGGTQMACRYEALSCDHLEYLSAKGVAAMARSGTVAVMLPAAYYFIRETQCPPLKELRQAGVPIALASDHNPGTAPILSPQLVMNMACTLFRMTPAECLRGYTLHAARALGLRDRGYLAPGMRADLAVWDVDAASEIPYWIGKSMCQSTYVGGKQWSA